MVDAWSNSDHWIWIVRFRSDVPWLTIPLQPAHFAKRTLTFLCNQPAVLCGGKLSLKKFYDLDPGFSVIVCAARDSEKVEEMNLENEFLI
jgi:hypothetical protein